MSRIENTHSAQSAKAHEQESERKDPNEKDVNDFNNLLHAKKTNSQDDDLYKLLKQNRDMSLEADKQLLDTNDNSFDAPSPNSLYSSLFSGQNLGQSANVDATQALQKSELSSDMVQELANRILVATNNDGSQEVRISLADKALAGTEVSIIKATDGQLTVRFDTTNPYSFQSLVSAQDTLKSALENQNANVRIEVNSGEQGSEQNPHGESRGKQQYFTEDEEQS